MTQLVRLQKSLWATEHDDEMPSLQETDISVWRWFYEDNANVTKINSQLIRVKNDIRIGHSCDDNNRHNSIRIEQYLYTDDDAIKMQTRYVYCIYVCKIRNSNNLQQNDTK